MRVLVTGGNGFLGSGIVRRLVCTGHDVSVLSRSSSNINDLIHTVKFIQMEDEVASFREQVFELAPDAVIDCAWAGGNSYRDINSLQQFYANMPRSIGLLELLGSMEKKPSYMGFGSFAEYGTLEAQAVETQDEVPESFYGLSKTAMKNISRMYCEQHDISWTWIRPCYTYGPRDVETRLIPKVIKSLLSKERLVLNSCQSTVDYLYIDDFSSAIHALLDKRKVGIFNICSGEQYKLMDILSLLRDEIGSSDITYDSSLDRGVSYRYTCGSNHKLKTETGWKPTVDIKQGILNTIAYYKMEMHTND